MNVNKIIIFILSVLILLACIGVGIFLFENHGNSQVSNTNTKIIQTSQGPINVQDYTQHPVQVTNDAIVIEQTNDYQILNFKADNSFLITLLAEPIGQSRTTAENAFLKDLNITQTQACELNVSVKTTEAVDPVYSGHELGMSFCPNSVSLQ